MAARHPYVPTISFGNWLTIAVMITGGVGTLVAVMSAFARGDEKVTANAEEIKAVEVRVNKRIDDMAPRVDQVAQQVAIVNANLQLIMRAQGLKPIEGGQQ